MSDTTRQRVAPIGKLLFDAGVVTREQVEQALDIQRREGGKTFEILVRLGHLDKSALHSVLSRQAGIASIDLARFKVSRDLLLLIPKDLALKELVLPIDKLGKLLTVAMACPLDYETIAQIEQLTGLSVKAMLAKYDDIAAAVEKHYPKHDSQHDAMPVFEMPVRRGGAASESAVNLTNDIKQLVLPIAAPGVADKVMELLKAAQPDLKAVMQAAANDPVLAAWILAMANSPAYGMPSQVESLGLAIPLLGVDGLKSTVEYFHQEAPAPKSDISGLLNASQKAALAGAVLAKKAGRPERSAGYTAGLLRRLGVYALATIEPAAASLPVDLPEEARCEQERIRFGITHLEAGAILGSRWRLPETLVASAGTAYDDAATPAPMLAVSAIAAALAERGATEKAGALKGLERHLAALGLDANAAYSESAKLIAG